jgi:hypothetical protein
LKRQQRPTRPPQLQIFDNIKGLALTRLETRVGLVDDVNATPAPHQFIIAMALD